MVAFIWLLALLPPTVNAGNKRSAEDLDKILHSASDSGSMDPYQLWDAHEVNEKLGHWKSQYPNLIRVTTAQDSFGLQRAGTSDDCPYDQGVQGCSNYFFTIQDFITHPEGSESSAHLPEVFWSGSLHGDERLGPTVVMESAALLFEAATCEAKPSRKASSWEREVNEAKVCRAQLRERGINDERRQWLSRLVSTRRIVVVPNANALGFFRQEHGEELTDPNEDFAYDQENVDSCMKTIAARTINEIFREHLFQLALSFHSGEGGIGYSWGSPSWPEQMSPDQRAQYQVAEAYSTVAGGGSPHQFGEVNKLFQYRRGTPEDWAYAASWDSDRVNTCTPESFGSYSKAKTTYNGSTNRAVAMMVSANTKNTQYSADLGSSLELFQGDHNEEDHLIPRNIRLALTSIDLVQPYVSIFGVNNVALSDDIVPLTDRSGRSCQQTKAVAVPLDLDKMIVEWSVGGGIRISQTDIWYAKWDDIPENELNCLMQPSSVTMENFNSGTHFGSTSGTAFFSQYGPSPPPDKSFIKAGMTLGPVFRAEINLEGFEVGDRIVLIASARVDQNWRKEPIGDYEPRTGPRSHLVNARTNPDWKHENAGKNIEGRLDWYSVPVTIVVDDFASRIGSLELYNRLGQEMNFGSGDNSMASKVLSTAKIFWLFLAVLCAIVMATFVVVTVIRRHSRSAIVKKVLGLEEDALEKQPGFVAKPSYVETPCGHLYEGDVDADTETEIIDFQAGRYLS
jgi:hypothetical protein